MCATQREAQYQIGPVAVCRCRRKGDKGNLFKRDMARTYRSQLSMPEEDLVTSIWRSTEVPLCASPPTNTYAWPPAVDRPRAVRTGTSRRTQQSTPRPRHTSLLGKFNLVDRKNVRVNPWKGGRAGAPSSANGLAGGAGSEPPVVSLSGRRNAWCIGTCTHFGTHARCARGNPVT